MPVLSLEPGDIVATEHGAAAVCGWAWNLTARRVRLRTVVLSTELRHSVPLAEDATVRCWRR